MNKISLQGSMAVGKTTVAKLLESEISNHYKVLFEYTKKRPEGLNPTIEQDFYKIQKYFIALEIARYNQYLNTNTVFDLGPEEIAFYTVNYPKACGYNWNVETNLQTELKQLHNCVIDRVVYLDADVEELNKRKKSDNTRDRGFFDTYINKLHPLKKQWMVNNYKTTVINVNSLSAEEMKDQIANIIYEMKIN